jgi:hypothetical protein
MKYIFWAMAIILCSAFAHVWFAYVPNLAAI